MSCPHTSISRRSFLVNAAAAGAACAAPTIVPRSVFGDENLPAPSERITVGMIAVGRQARAYNVPQFLKMPDVQIVAVCEVDAWRLKNAKQQVEEGYAKRKVTGYRGCATYGDFHDLLARKDIDAVMISSPDHWHVPMAMAALEAGKDVSLEKPITRAVADGRKLANLVAARKRVFRVDSELRSKKHIVHAAELCRNGRIGKIEKITVGVPFDKFDFDPKPDMPVPADLDYERWQGPSPRAPYTEARVHPPKSYDRAGWMRHMYYTDGMITNWTSHLNDTAAWCADLEQTGPVEIEATGAYPPPASFWNVLIKFDVKMRYANGVHWTFRTEEPYFKIEGDKGWIWGDFFSELRTEPASLLTATIGPDELHFPRKSDKRDFIDSVKTRQQPLEPIEVGHRITSLGLLGQIAVQIGGKLQWDPDKELFVGNDAANAMLDKPLYTPHYT